MENVFSFYVVQFVDTSTYWNWRTGEFGKILDASKYTYEEACTIVQEEFPNDPTRIVHVSGSYVMQVLEA